MDVILIHNLRLRRQLLHLTHQTLVSIQGIDGLAGLPLRSIDHTYQQLHIIALDGVSNGLLETGERRDQLHIRHPSDSYTRRLNHILLGDILRQHHIQIVILLEVDQHVVVRHVDGVHTTHSLHCLAQTA